MDTFVNEFRTCSRIQFSGELNVQDIKGNQRSFYYRLGRLVWATGGVHPVRCWRRQLTQHCPQIDVERLQIPESVLTMNCWDYHILATLYKQQQLQLKHITAIVVSTIAEHLFDVSQQAMSSPLSCNRSQANILDEPLTFSNTDLSLKQMQQAWTTWCDAGLANLSPDLAPVLPRPKQIQQQVNPRVYQNLVTLINGKDTLRDLSVRMNQDLVQLTLSLVPYVSKGLIGLVQVPDLPSPSGRIKAATTTHSVVKNSPLVACIDDSPQTCQMLEQIFTSNGLRFVGIQDSLQALPVLIEAKPDLIFLDLIMPVANGYEICAQLRRVSLFASTPVIILTGSDGLVDRVRAKVVGASDFLAKPIEVQKVLNVVHKHLPTFSPPSTAIQSSQLSVINCP